MWFPVEMHSPQAQRDGLAGQLARRLGEHGHHWVVREQRLCPGPSPAGGSPEEIVEVVRAFEVASLSYLGARHGALVAPYAAFSVAFGVARLEHLLDHDPPGDELSSWVKVALQHFALVLLKEQRPIHSVVLPVALDLKPEDGLLQQRSAGALHHVTRGWRRGLLW